MTASDLTARARALRDRIQRLPFWLVFCVSLAAVIASNVHACNRVDELRRAAATAAARAPEEAGARRDGVPVVEQLPPEAFERLAREREREIQDRGNAEMQLSLARARAAVPGVRVVGTIRAAVEGAAAGKPRPQDAPPTGDAAGAPDAGHAQPPAGATCSTCLLAQGDGLRLELEGLQLRGPAGGRYLVGTLAAFRKVDGELLLRRPLEGERVEIIEEAPPAPREPGRILGLGVGTSTLTQRWQLSGVLVDRARRVPLVGWKLRPWVFAAGGPGREPNEVELVAHGGVAAEF